MWSLVLRVLAMRLLAPALALAVLTSPSRAVTCEEARNLSAGELSHYAARLEVSPGYLAALLQKAFCEVPATGERATTAPDRKRSPAKQRAAG
jgi:hypothetical protein